LRSAVEGGEELADGAEAEHMAVSTMVAEIYGSATPERLPDVVAQLREAVRTHVEEEETVLFPAMRDSKVDAGKLAADLAAAEDVHGSSS
jgi:iron-sulfur cluster repair protein YtfE (RIC family)